jgi:hypothetical protein
MVGDSVKFASILMYSQLKINYECPYTNADKNMCVYVYMLFLIDNTDTSVRGL